METNLKELNKEEEKLYKKFGKYLKFWNQKERQEFYNLLDKWVDIQIEIEKFCSE